MTKNDMKKLYPITKLFISLALLLSLFIAVLFDICNDFSVPYLYFCSIKIKEIFYDRG